MQIKAAIFDVFGTCVDWRSGIASAFQPIFETKGIALDPAHFADQWRGRYQPSMAPIREGHLDYVPLDILHRENLDFILNENGLDHHFDEAERSRLSCLWEQLPPWPDTVAGLRAIRKHVSIAPCSNGSIKLMMHLARHAALPWDCILGADLARNYKPHPAVYLQTVAALQLQPEEVLMVAAHNDDLYTARELGLRTAFLPRPREHGPSQTTDLVPEADWDIVADDLMSLSGRLSAIFPTNQA